MFRPKKMIPSLAATFLSLSGCTGTATSEAGDGGAAGTGASGGRGGAGAGGGTGAVTGMGGGGGGGGVAGAGGGSGNGGSTGGSGGTVANLTESLRAFCITVAECYEDASYDVCLFAETQRTEDTIPVFGELCEAVFVSYFGCMASLSCEDLAGADGFECGTVFQTAFSRRCQ